MILDLSIKIFLKKKNIGNKEIVIIICLNDGMKHEVVAEEFFENGINKILFLPMNSGRSLEIDSIYRKSYTDFLDMSYDNAGINRAPEAFHVWCTQPDNIRTPD